MIETVTTDCLILGGGLAGLMAAREAVRAGLRVKLLQDGQGASPWVHGVNIPLHPKDSIAAFLDDTLVSGHGLSRPALAQALCGDAPEMFGEIEALGLAFNREGDGYQFLQPLGASWPRVMSVGNETGVAVLKALRAELEHKADVCTDFRAVRLRTDGNRVTGALAFDQRTETWKDFRAATTVLACGGFCGIYPFSTNKRDSGGDGIAMAYYAGAKLCDMEFIQFEPSGAVWPEALRGTGMITTMFYDGAVLRNRSGERFMLRYGPEAERVNKDRLAECIAKEINEGGGTEHGGVYFDATALGKDKLNALYSMYVKRYQNVGIDLSREWIELAPTPHTSLGGVWIDAHGATTLDGLYACGEVTGGLHGANRIGGSAGLETLVFGRRAGRAAAAYAADHRASGEKPGDGTPDDSGRGDIGETLVRLRHTIQSALRDGANVLRDGKTLADSLHKLDTVYDRLKSCESGVPKEQFLRYRLDNDLCAARLLCLSALTREDSAGCHIRTDFPAEAAVPYHVTLRRLPSGKTDVRREPAQ